MAATAYIVLALCALANGAFLRRPQLDGRILGGEEANIRDYPYQLALQNYGYQFCGASIIAEKWVLTSAQCVARYFANGLTVRAGSSIRDSGGYMYQVAEIIKHPEYNPDTRDYDFALLELETPIQFRDGVQPIALADYEPPVGEDSVISGWGGLFAGAVFTGRLHAAHVPIVDRTECDDAYGSITDRMICAGLPEGDKEACKNDLGGPLVVYGQLAGVISWDGGCVASRYPGVFSNVADQRAWIKETSGV